MLDSVDTHHGMPHCIRRSTLYEDCFTLCEQHFATLKMEYPFRIAYQHEQAVDTGGVARDMFSGFWELAYVNDMDGASTCIPMVNPHITLSRYNVLGSIICHGFMSTGFLPSRLSFPVLAYTLLGCDVEIPQCIIADCFMDYISDFERSVFYDALRSREADFPPRLQETLVRVLGGMGCRKVPSSHNITQLITDVARHELMVKPLAAMHSLRVGLPTEYLAFWSD